MLKILYSEKNEPIIKVDSGKKLERMGFAADPEFKEKYEKLALEMGYESSADMLRKHAERGFIEELKQKALVEKYGCKELELTL